MCDKKSVISLIENACEVFCKDFCKHGEESINAMDNGKELEVCKTCPCKDLY